ncbi:HlyD family type I secretion periplasmic adaptor subunit [Terasakiella sp.]|uniref:HlyD family type I secretion periplasmic adaptor subunit n=1 Tax=Terasakiella sp. TaxID=2034861 RepID=UPI003AA9491C
MSNAANMTSGIIEKKKASRQIRYMAQYVQLEEQGISGLSRAAIALVTLILVCFVVWSNFMKVDEVAVTFGAVVPKGSVRSVQHLEGGIVKETYVEERQIVEAGQPLLELDEAQVGAELQQVNARLLSLKLREERLRATAYDRELDYSNWKGAPFSLVQDQVEIYTSTLERLQSQRNVFEQQHDQKIQEIDATRNQQAAVERQLALIEEEVQMRGELYEKGHGSKVSFLEVKRAMAAMQSELSRLVGQEQSAMEAVEEIEDRIADLEKTERKNALAELGTVTAETSQVQELIHQLEDRFNRLQIVSPVRGYVKDIKIKSKGGIVPAGGIVMEVVPIDDELRVETRISTKDVGHVNLGQPVTVKVASFDFARYGSVSGVLDNISATTYIDETNGAPYYKGIVKLDTPYVGEDPEQNKIVPGMTVQADIMTGEKTLFQYLLKPIYVSLQQSFRER